MILLFFLLWRMFDFLIIFFSQKYISYLGFFPYADQLLGFHLPAWVYALANFDGLHYILIAKNGYSQFEQAFFPLYPLVIKFLSPLFAHNQLLTGIIISNVSFLIGLYIFSIIDYAYLPVKQGLQVNRNWLILFLLVFPTSFFFGAVYTEGLFFLLLMLSLYSLKKEKYLFVAIFAFLASLTRLIGVFLIIPIMFHIFDKYQKSKVKSQNLKSKVKSFQYFIINTKYLILIIAPLLGLGIYCFYLFKTTGDPFFFLTSQPLFGAHRSSHLIILPQVYWRYLKIFITAQHDSRYLISVIEFLIFNFVFIVLILDLFKNLGIKNLKLTPIQSGLNKNLKIKISNLNLIGLNLFSFTTLILPTLTGTFSSIPRYTLFSLSFFIFISQIKNNFIKYLLIMVFAALHILLLGLFTQGYFVS